MRTTAGSHTSSSIFFRRSSDTVVPGYSFPSTPQPYDTSPMVSASTRAIWKSSSLIHTRPRTFSMILPSLVSGEASARGTKSMATRRVTVDQLPAQFREAVDAEDVIHGRSYSACARAWRSSRFARSEGDSPARCAWASSSFRRCSRSSWSEIRLAARPTVHLDQSPVRRNRPGARVHLEHLRRSSRHFAELRQMHFAAHLPVGVLWLRSRSSVWTCLRASCRNGWRSGSARSCVSPGTTDAITATSDARRRIGTIDRLYTGRAASEMCRAVYGFAGSRMPPAVGGAMASTLPRFACKDS